MFYFVFVAFNWVHSWFNHLPEFLTSRRLFLLFRHSAQNGWEAAAQMINLESKEAVARKDIETGQTHKFHFLMPDFKMFLFYQYSFFNRSQTKYVAIILVLSVLYAILYAILRLTTFSSDAFDFLSSKTG